MLTQTVSLHDIADAEAFVRANIRRSGVILTSDEREELIAEGLAILCDMATKFIVRMPGYAKDGSFAGYASRYLPKRMKEAYHSLHPEHVQRTDQDGKKYIEYKDAPWPLHTFLGDMFELDEAKTRFVGDFVPCPAPQAAGR